MPSPLFRRSNKGLPTNNWLPLRVENTYPLGGLKTQQPIICNVDRLHFSFWILFSLITLGGCSVGPDYEAPVSVLPTDWNLEQPSPPAADTLRSYWQRFEDPLLTILVGRALQDNRSLRQTVLRIDEAAALYQIQRGEFFPDIDAQGTLRRSKVSEAVVRLAPEPRNDFLALGATMAWEIDLFGRLRRLRESAEASFEASIADYNAALVSLSAEVALSYIRIRTLQQQVLLTQDNIRAQSESLDLTKSRFAVGIAPELDVKQAESNLGETKAALPALQIRLQQEIHRMAVLLGVFPEEVRGLFQNHLGIPRTPEIKFQNLPMDIIRQRPDIRRVERQLAAQHALIGARQAEFYPIISLPGEFSFEALNDLHNAFDTSSIAYSIGPSIRWNLFDMGRVSGALEVEKIRTEQRQQEYQQQVLTAVREVEDAAIAYSQQQIRVSNLNNSVDASKKARELVKALYVSGLTDFQNVLDSEQRLFAQQISLAQSQGATVEAYVSLFRALGGGWSALSS